MSDYVVCKDEDGFEDQLTSSTPYAIREVGVNSYLIENDNEELRWYGDQNFSRPI